MSGLVGSSPFITRAEWGARPPKSALPTNITPQGNTGHYEGPALGAYSHDRCASMVRGIQAFHMDSRGWLDIAYSSISCIHGCVFEGRWLGHRTAANGSNEGNQVSYAHCVLLGDGDPFPDLAKRAMHDVFGYFQGHGSGTQRWPHLHWFNTSCPGHPVADFIAAGLPFPNSGGPVVPQFDPPYLVPPTVSDLACPTGGAWTLGTDGSVDAWGGAPNFGAVNGKPYFAGRKPARIVLREPDSSRWSMSNPPYSVVATSGESYGAGGF